MNIPYVFKKCSKCGEWLVANSVNFAKNKNTKDGLQYYCRHCKKNYNKQYNKQYYQANIQYFHKHNKQYNEEHRQERQQYNKQYYEQHRDELLQYNKQYHVNNKQEISQRHKIYYNTPQGQIVAFNCYNKRKLHKEEQGNGITSEQWLEMMQFFDFKCAYSDKYIGGKENQNIRSIDHIIPLAKGGAHEIYNLVPMYRPYNSSKKEKDIMEWYTAQEFYSKERLDKILAWQEYAYNKWCVKEKAE